MASSSSSLCKNSVPRVYQDVIEDVIQNVREAFLEDGVDETMLQELKQAWEVKLLASKAVDKHDSVKMGSIKPESSKGSNGIQVTHQSQLMKQVVGQVPPNNHVQTVAQIENKLVPIQITLPPQPGTGSDTPRILTIHVPSVALQGNQLHKILTGPIISATMNLPQQLASNMLQQHVNAHFNIGQPQLTLKTVIQTDGALDSDTEREMEANGIMLQMIQKKIVTQEGVEIILSHLSNYNSTNSTKAKTRRRKQKKAKVQIEQVDGPNDTSDDDEASEDDASDDVEEDKEEDNELDNAGQEEEPLNSEDDVTDEDLTDLFDTDNVIVCQYDKITRSRNKWKFHFKDGIMHLDGEDYVFQKANGDAEW